MDVFNLSQEPYEKEKKLTLSEFERLTQKQYPFYQPNQSGDISAYAVCPYCKSPIEIIHAVRTNKDSKVYGKHYNISVKGVADFNLEDFEHCIYRAKAKSTFSRIERKQQSALTSTILKVITEQFDRIIYMLGRDTGIKFSNPLSKKMLSRFIQNNGERYAGINLANIPWILGYLSDSQSLYMQYLDTRIAKEITGGNGKSLYDTLKEHPKILLVPSDDNKVVQIKTCNGYLQLLFCFHSHKVIKSEDSIKETIVFSVSSPKEEFDFTQPKNPLNHILFEKTITFNTTHWKNLIQLNVSPHRNAVLLSTAKELIK